MTRTDRDPAAARMARGFTLIEMMIVVAIVGILASLAVVGYRKLITQAHTSEATHMVQSIRVAQEAYHAEAQTYVSTVANQGSLLTTASMYPQWVIATKTNWTTPTGTCNPAAPDYNCFALLPVHTDGPVLYGYSTFGATSATNPGTIQIPGGGPALAGPATSSVDWYWVAAAGQVGKDTQVSYVVGNSFTNDLFVQEP